MFVSLSLFLFFIFNKLRIVCSAWLCFLVRARNRAREIICGTKVSSPNKHQQQQQQQSAAANPGVGATKYDHYHDHDRISVSSLNTALNIDDTRSQHGGPSQRRSSVLRRHWAQHTDVPFIIGAHITEESQGLCGKVLVALSWFLIVLFFPFSLFVTLKVVQEYEYNNTIHLDYLNIK